MKLLKSLVLSFCVATPIWIIAVCSCAAILAGCSSMISETERTPVFPTYVSVSATNEPTAFKEKTTLRIRTLFDAKSEVTKMSNRSGYNAKGTWGPGTYAAGVNDSSSGSNVVAILHELGNIAGQAAAAAAK